MSKQSLTASFLADPHIADLYQRATQAQFLRLAGQGRLSHQTLSEWLSQDRLYAQAYVRFIGGLISRVMLPIEVDIAGAGAGLQWRLLTLLQGCLAGIMRELRFFEETAASYGLDLAATRPGEHTFGPNATTKAYMELFDSFAVQSRGDSPRTLFDGLVVLWATEKAYLTAWSYAQKSSDSQNENWEKDLDGGALRKHFIPNWTSRPFQEFIEEIQGCLNAYAESSLGEENEKARFSAAAAMVKKVLVLEEAFWPVIPVDDGI
ncbi:heme oxygenase-like protein [Xylaria bambusicola]|uniref:heme oxygenase-like protein n=1 Tax=Xylaria bambusicola TaxID=326684 RepID=UPI00200749B5|nr:heme oxygenase-like protein [Xylaria bambusicola]KAI0514784.1 heme oxygenase-like protein [Xylaria bambusicola]